MRTFTLPDDDPFTLEWGPSTPERVDEQRKLALHIFNHDLETPRSVDRTIRFAAGRIEWLRRNLPAGFKQIVAFDDRGQRVGNDQRTRLKALAGDDVEVAFFTEGFPGGLQSPR